MVIKLSEMKPQQTTAESDRNATAQQPQQGRRTVVKYVQRLLIYVDPAILHYC
jgi:hypothetical protein